MTHKTERIGYRVATAVYVAGMLGFLSACIVVLAPIFGPRLERLINPVLTDEPTRTSVIRKPDGGVEVGLWATKHRRCAYVDDSASYLAGSDEAGWQRVFYSRPGTTMGPTRDIGEQYFGIWRFEGVEAGLKIKGIWRYRCHDHWETAATLGPWTAP